MTAVVMSLVLHHHRRGELSYDNNNYDNYDVDSGKAMMMMMMMMMMMLEKKHGCQWQRKPAPMQLLINKVSFCADYG